MSVSGIGGRSQLAVQSLVDMRRQLDDLHRQLGTGKKSTTHAGLGADRGLAAGLRAQLASLKSYGETITMLGVRLDMSQTVLTRMTALRSEAKASLQQSAEIRATGQSPAQDSARHQLDEFLELLNTDINGRYLFAGREVDRAPVASAAHILDGDGARAGLKQVVTERALADIGANGLGRLDVSVALGTVSLGEQVAGSPFGFKLSAVASTLTGVTVGGPAGAPPAISVALAANPNAGETLTITLDLPDGTQEAVKLTATTDTPPAAGQFTIGANQTATAANLHAALTAAVGGAAKTSLAAASALAAADDFFNIGPGDPPRRVAGPPFETATALAAGTPGNTVTWYTGELSTDPPRSSALGRVDDAVAINYGMRATEDGIRLIVQNMAAFAATSFDPNAAETPARYAELTERLTPALSGAHGAQRLEDVVADLAHAQISTNAAKQRHQQTNSVLNGLLGDIEGVPAEQVATEILALQTRLQASLQTTAILYQLSLTNYL